MKKRYSIMIVLYCVIILSFIGCDIKQDKKKTEDEKVVKYEEYEFIGVQWSRDSECDVENLCFLPNGEFRYSCGCGNPVNDADVVESYSFDETTNMFTLNCYEDIEGMVTEIKLISCDGERLELDFEGEVRVFFNEEQ
jgi:hypothetical protein